MSSEHHEDHGHTVAAWTAVVIILLGCGVSAIAFPMNSAVVFWVGVVIAVLGVVAGKVLQVMGLGQEPKQAPKQAPAESPAKTSA